MNVSLSDDVRHDCWFSYSSDRVSGSEAVASWMAYGKKARSDSCIATVGKKE